MNRKFGRVVSPFDPRDFNLKNFIPRSTIGTLVTEKLWDFPQESLDQGETPHCVGFSMANFGINLPVLTPYTNEAGHKFYYKCKVIDGDPKAENGTTIRSAAKVLRNEGIINAYAFAYDINMVKWWLLNRGPLVVGTIWTTDMMEPDEEGMIYPTGATVGGHGFIINGITKDDKVRFKNSWGDSWGLNGSAFMYLKDFEKLLRYDGEVMTAVELEDHSSKECWLIKVIRDRVLRNHAICV